MTRTVYFPVGDTLVEKMFVDAGWTIADRLTALTDLVQFVGGTDVHPALYGQHKHPKTFNNNQRDLIDFHGFQQARLLDVPCAGICRGAQFLHVMMDGELFQDIDNHAISGTHDCTDTRNGDVFRVTSTHHQMVKQNNNMKVVYAANLARKLERMSELGKPAKIHTTFLPNSIGVPIDVEGYYYPGRRVGGFQGHPEYEEGRESRSYYFDLLEQFVLKPERKN